MELIKKVVFLFGLNVDESTYFFKMRPLQLSARWPVLHIATIREPEIDQKTDTGTNT